jgi:hypothetical protein
MVGCCWQETSGSTDDTEAQGERDKFEAWTEIITPEQLLMFYDMEARINADE